MKSLALAVTLVCAMTASASAKGLGDRGAKSINGAFTLDLSNRSDSESDVTTTSITVAPNGDLFVAPNVSLGGGILVGYSKTGDASTTIFGIEGRFGYYLPLGSIGLWMLVGAQYVHASSEIDVPIIGNLNSSGDALALKLFVPLVFNITPNFFLGLGPAFTQEVFVDDDNDNNDPDAKTRVIGITSIVGGAW